MGTCSPGNPDRDYQKVIDAGKKADQALAKAEKSIRKARSWVTAVLISRYFSPRAVLLPAIKWAKMRDAETDIHKAEDLLSVFNQELKNVLQKIEVYKIPFPEANDLDYRFTLCNPDDKKEMNNALDVVRQLRESVGNTLKELEIMQQTKMD